MSKLLELPVQLAGPALVRIRLVNKSYGQTRVLDNISLDVHAGEVRCIIGPSGSGKSTLLRCINALAGFDDGVIVVGGVRVGYAERDGRLKPWTEREAAAFRSRVGFVSQHVNLFWHRTVMENIIEGPKHVLGLSDTVARDQAKELLARVGLADKHDSYPIQLSGGQQQRVAITQALAMQPQLILFDEATSALDPELVGEVLAVMRGLARDGMMMIVVTHEMRFTADMADQVTVLKGGRVIEDASAKDVFNQPRHPRTAEFLATHFEFAGGRAAQTV